jgi:cell division protein ZapA (FtsZ GTPase activity inhibitor)
VTKRAVSVRISGQEYRIRSDADESSLQRVAQCVDVAMDQIRSRTGTVDTLGVAILTSLNLAREVLSLRERASHSDAESSEPGRLRDLIELAESVLIAGSRTHGDTHLLTLPTREELDDSQHDLLDPLLEEIDAIEVESRSIPV